MKYSEFCIVVPSLINNSVSHIDNYAFSLGIAAFICIPESLHGPFQHTPNITYLRSFSSGQVAQRLFAANSLNSTYVLAMDDDIHIPSDLLPDLLNKYLLLLSSYANPVLGVQIISRSQPLISSRKLSPFALKLLSIIENTTVQHLQRPSTLSPLCFNSNHDSSYTDSYTLAFGCYRSDWISGGLFIAPRSLFPLTSYYPFKGKAFAEDVILSCIFSRSGASLFIANSVTALTGSILPSYTIPNMRAKFYLLRFSTINFRYVRFIFSIIVRQLSLMRII